MRVEEGFNQVPFPQEHPYLDDPVLPGLFKRILPHTVKEDIDSELKRLGETLLHDIRPSVSPLVRSAVVTQYNEWGQRVDKLHTSEGWRRLEQFAVMEGYNAVAIERKQGAHSRTCMFARTMVMTGDCHVIMCPMGTTDGAARVIELFGTEEMRRELLPRLCSRDPKLAYLSGQWMTERPGGSDVSLTETRATPVERVGTDLGDPYILNGFKWFASVAEAHMALALARTGELEQGSGGLSLFLVPLRIGPYTSPLSNGVLLHRLKDKVGTHGVPTAELSINGARGWLIGRLNEGVKTIAPVLNITRVHSAVHSVGSLQRCLSIARSYATVRAVNRGQILLKDVPLHISSIADVNVLYRALVHLTFGVVELLGKSECGTATPEDSAILRLLTPAVKAFAAEKAVGGMEECMAALGGQGYLEEVGIGRLIRDAMVEKIWEGTLNILAVDLNRVFKKDPQTIMYWTKWARSIVISGRELRTLQQESSDVMESLAKAVENMPHYFKLGTADAGLLRLILDYFAHASCALYLLEHAVWSQQSGEISRQVDTEVFLRWTRSGELASLEHRIEFARGEGPGRFAMDSKLVYGERGYSAKL